MNLNPQIQKYKTSFQKYGSTHKALGWTLRGQHIRFQELLRDINLEDKSILDFGCGLGDLLAHILGKNSSFEYKGVDVIPEFISAAADAYKNRSNLNKKVRISFLLQDIIKKPLQKKFDVVICSGALNANSGDAINYRKKAIKTLWNQTEEVLAFNMAGGHPQPKNKISNRVFYADSLEILTFCFSLTSKIIFRNSYHKKDFTILMYK